MRCVLLGALLFSLTVTAAPKEILVLHSYRVGYDWTDEVSRGLRTKFAVAGEYNLWFEFLDARRETYPRNAAAVRDMLARKYGQRKIDLVIASDDEAVDFLARRSEGLFASVPVVFCGLSEAGMAEGLDRGRFTGLIEIFDAKQILALAKRLRPGTKQVYFAHDRSPFGSAMGRIFREEQAAAKDGTALHVLDGAAMRLEEILKAVGEIPADGVLLLTQVREDQDGRYVGAVGGELAIAAASAAPTVGVAVSEAGRGVLMGTPNRGFQHAALAAAVGLRVLGGERPERIPIVGDGGIDTQFDYGEMRRWGIPESRLPARAVVVNRPANGWQEYWRWIAAGGVFAIFQLVVIVGLVRSNLRRRKAEGELRLALEKAREAQAMKSRFIANMSHELRTPMNGVLGLLQVLRTSELDKEQRETAELAENSARSLLTVLNDLLDLSQVDAGRLKIAAGPFSLRKEVERVGTLLTPRAEEARIALRWSVAESVPACLIGDSDRLRQIVINLTSNALKFTKRGEVRITAKELERTEERSLIRLEVRDTGIGISPEMLGRIFEPFVQVDDSSARRFGGLGLGLAISRELVGVMGGRIGGESVPGEGSVFWVEIPLGYELGWTAQREAETVPALEGKVVLVVEDNAVNRMVARKLLERSGCRTVVAEDGEQCLQRLREGGVDLVLMDVQMPGMSGLEVTREIRTWNGEKGRVPIIALTASSMVGDREACLAAGMNDYLAKPIAAGELMGVLERWTATG